MLGKPFFAFSLYSTSVLHYIYFAFTSYPATLVHTSLRLFHKIKVVNCLTVFQCRELESYFIFTR